MRHHPNLLQRIITMRSSLCLGTLSFSSVASPTSSHMFCSMMWYTTFEMPRICYQHIRCAANMAFPKQTNTLLSTKWPLSQLGYFFLTHRLSCCYRHATVSGCHFRGLILPEISVNPCFHYFSSDDMHTHKKKLHAVKATFQCFVHVWNHFDSVLTLAKCFLPFFDSLWTFLLIELFSSSSPNPWPKLFVLSPPGVLLSTAPTPEHFDARGWSTVVGLVLDIFAELSLHRSLSCIQQCCSPPSVSRNLRLGSESPGGCCMHTHAETMLAIGRMRQVFHF